MPALHDMHCHLSFAENAEEIANSARESGSLLFSNSVSPDEWNEARGRFAPFENVKVGFGMHPWWVRESTSIRNALEKANPRLIGEVGLDFGKRHRETRDAQISVFQEICQWASKQDGALMSIHSVNAISTTLDTLEKTGALSTCTCVFHWFSGSSVELKRGIDAGCFFSIGPRMLATKKGREYVKAIPKSRMLLETDDPPDRVREFSYATLRSHLEQTATEIASIKGPDALELIEATSRMLLESPIL